MMVSQAGKDFGKDFFDVSNEPDVLEGRTHSREMHDEQKNSFLICSQLLQFIVGGRV